MKYNIFIYMNGQFRNFSSSLNSLLNKKYIKKNQFFSKSE